MGLRISIALYINRRVCFVKTDQSQGMPSTCYMSCIIQSCHVVIMIMQSFLQPCEPIVCFMGLVISSSSQLIKRPIRIRIKMIFFLIDLKLFNFLMGCQQVSCVFLLVVVKYQILRRVVHIIISRYFIDRNPSDFFSNGIRIDRFPYKYKIENNHFLKNETE